MASMLPSVSDSLSIKLELLLIACAKKSLNNDFPAAKAWLLTAKVLYPNNFGVQFLAYQIEKSTKNIKDSAKCFSELLAAFSSEEELCNEVVAMTTALRAHDDNEVSLNCADYLVQLFYQLPQPVQRALVLNCAKSTTDAEDHCRRMLLLFKKFPDDLILFGAEVMEGLITAEKHSFKGNPLNCYRKLLVCDLLPLIARSQMDVPVYNIIRLLNKAAEFYVVSAFNGSKKSRRDEVAVDDPWARLWETILLMGDMIKWDLTTGFTRYWSRDSFFKSVDNLRDIKNDAAAQREIAYCTLAVLLRCVHEYLPVVEPGNSEQGFVLVEAFVESDSGQAGLSNKMQKVSDDPNAPLITAGSGAPPHLTTSFLAAIRCLEALHRNDYVRIEYLRLRSQWKADKWLHTFLMDAIIYQGTYEPEMMLQPRRCDDSRTSALVSELTHLTCYYRIRDNLRIVDSIAKIAGLLGQTAISGGSGGHQLLATTRRMRHVHFLPITRPGILQYCVKVLLQILKKKTSDMALGHTLVLMQLNWPQEADNLSEISELITIRGSFTYPLFSSYIVNIDIIERFAYLAGPDGPKIPLNIFAGTPIHSQRRMSTRGIDKGVREDFRMALRAQVARWNEPVDELIIRFLKCEKDLIQHSLLP